MPKKQTDNLILMAEIVGVHGIKGAVKLKVFSEDPDALAETPLFDSAGKPTFKIARLAPHGNIWLADLDGVKDRTAAERLRGTQLFLTREDLPDIEEKDTYYHTDLVGLTAKHVDGRTLGTVIAVANFGAGDLLDIRPEKGNSFYVPFTGAIVPDVNLKTKELIIDPPEGLID